MQAHTPFRVFKQGQGQVGWLVAVPRPLETSLLQTTLNALTTNIPAGWGLVPDNMTLDLNIVFAEAWFSKGEPRAKGQKTLGHLAKSLWGVFSKKATPGALLARRALRPAKRAWKTVHFYDPSP